MTSLALWTQSVSAVFYPAVFFHNHNLRALNSIARYEKNEQVHKAGPFKRQTLTFIFQHKFHINLSIYPVYQVNSREWTAASVASVVTSQNSTAARSFLLNNTFSTLSKLFTPNMYYRSSKIIVTIYWMQFYWITLVLSCLAQRKRMTERRSLQDAFNGNVAICNVHNWPHSDVIVINSQILLRNKFPTKCISRIFHILKISRMMPFSNLFMGYDPRKSLICW